jgi:mono/diheme cytochrome c family protein
MNKKRKFPIFLIPLSLMLIVFLQAFISGEHDQTGEDLYRSYCASCHGVNGDGAGDLAYLVYPKPRDFTGGKFKIKSTLPGLPPTDDDLFKSISSGMPGTAMPSFNFLEEDEINTLVEIVKEHSGIENDNVHPMNIPEEIPFSDELIQLGKVVYDEAGCNMCHGDNGKGDGPSSDRLMDTYGFPIVPKDFTSGVYLGGGAIQDLYLRFVGGMDGTPMPSYGNLAELLGRPKTEESKLAWALVHYVKSLEVPQKDKINAKPNNGIIDAKKFERLEKFDDLTDGFSDIWKKSSTYSIPLSRLWQSENANYQMMGVQAIYNDEYVAVKLEWKDPTIDQGISRIQDFQDGAAIQFSLDGSKGFHGMGSKDHPTDIWFWKAEWQKRIDTNMESDITLAYANRVSDSDIKQFPSVMNDVAYLAGRDAGNLNAYTTQLSSIENARATGPETITPFHKDDQEVFGKGIWDGGKWRVVFVRKRIPSLIEKVNFNKNKSIPIGFAVWNGSEQDRNGQKMVSTWYDLELKD